jgi:hypothetical protein
MAPAACLLQLNRIMALLTQIHVYRYHHNHHQYQDCTSQASSAIMYSSPCTAYSQHHPAPKATATPKLL